MAILELDDIIYDIQRFGGATTYWQELSKRLDACFPGEIIHNRARKYFRLYSPSSTAKIFHSSHFRVSSSKNVKNVVTIHDLIYEKGLIGGVGKFVQLYERRKAVENADAFICISLSTMNDFLNSYPEASSKPIKIIHHGVNSLPDVEDKKSLMSGIIKKFNISLDSEKYFLFVGGRDGYKNFSSLLRSFSMGNFKRKGYRIFCTGQNLSDKEMVLIQSLHLTDYVTSLGKLEPAELREVYAHAVALVYPSLYEGFGLPPLEAMASGCPVICFATSSLPEVVGDAGLLVEASRPDELVDAMKLVLDENTRYSLISKGFENVKKFSWDKSAEMHCEVYRSLI